MPREKTRLIRLTDRGSYDPAVLHEILDEAILCHVAFHADGQLFNIPTLHARQGDHLLLHGSAASRILRGAVEGIELCVCVTLIDGLVLARSAFHHSANYRSAVIFGEAKSLEDSQTKAEALRLFSEHIVKDRWDQIRPPTDIELKQTRVLSLPLNEFSVKIRTGPPKDDEEDYALPVWAGVLPIENCYGAPIPDPRLDPKRPIPDHVRNYRRP